jgi:predicted dehydrogenase
MSRRIAILGLGAAATKIHLAAYRRAGVEVVGGYDPRVRAGKFSFPMFGSPEELIDRTAPDVVAVATPTSTHFELTRLALESGCHVLCEKPFTSTVDEAHAILRLAASQGRRVVVNNQFRFMRSHAAAKRLIGGPEFGELLFLQATQTFRTEESTEAGWRGGDIQRTCKEFGIHVIDLCRFFFSAEPERIVASMPRPTNPAGPDYLNLIRLEFPGERVAAVTLDRLSRGRHRYLEMRLDGERACIETRLGGGIEFEAGLRGGSRRPYVRFDVSLGGRARLYRGERFRKIASDPLDVFAAATGELVRQMFDAIEHGQVPPCDATDNVKSLELMYAAYESAARGGEPIAVNHRPPAARAPFPAGAHS